MTRREIIKQGGLALTVLALPFPLTAFTKFSNMTDNKNFDVIIIGGSYAGLSAAMALGRAMRNVLIIDSGLPCNLQTPHSHNFITQDGETPAAITVKAKQQVLKYTTIQILKDLAIGGEKVANGFRITTQNGSTVTAKKLIFATGVKDIMPDIKGFAECWGISILHCPYCHGYEVKNEKTGVFANGDTAYQIAQLISNWTKDITIFTNGKADFSDEHLAKLREYAIPIVEKEIAYLQHEKGYVQQLVFADNATFELMAIYARPPFEQHCKIPETLGCELTEAGHIKVDAFQKTTIKDVFACGDCTSFMRSVANAVSSGNMAAAMLNNGMIAEDF